MINTEFQKGFSLIEVVVAIAAFAIAFSFLIDAFFPRSGASVNPVLQLRSAELAQAYMEEILGKRFDENNALGSGIRCGAGPACTAVLGPEPGETRATYDDVDDFQDQDGLPDIPTDAFGNVRSAYANYRVLVTIAYAGADISLPNADAKRIDIRVTAPNGDIMDFLVYKGNF